jgi:hypothetical protein
MSRVATAITADALGIAAATPKVELVDSHGDLALVVSAPIRVQGLSTSEGGAPARHRTVLESAEQAQAEIKRRLTELTGSTVSRVVIRITGADIKQERRVR